MKRGLRLMIGVILLGCPPPTAAPGPAQSGSTPRFTNSTPTSSERSFTQALADVQALRADSRTLAEAEIQGKRLLGLAVDRFGPDSAEAIEVRGLLVHILMEIGKKRLPEAISVAEEALASAERFYPPHDPRLRRPLNDLGDALAYLGSFAEAQAAFNRALEICEAQMDPLDSCKIAALTSLGNNSRQLGDYAASRLYLDRALAMSEAQNTTDAPDIAGLLYALSSLCSSAGDLDEALAFAERGVRILEAAPVSSPEKFFLYQLLNQLAGVYRDLGRYGEARDLLDRCIRHFRKTQGEKGRDLSMVLSNQARSLARLGEHAAALRQAEQALNIILPQVAPDDRTLVFYLRNLALVHIDAGQEARAEPLLERAVRLKALAYGPDHDSLAPLLDLLAGVEYRLGRRAEAMRHALRAESIARGTFQDITTVLPERQAYRYEASRASSLRFALSALSGTTGPRSARLVEQVWDNVVRSRALVLDEIASRAHALKEQSDPEMQALVRELQLAKSRLAAVVLLGSDFDHDPRSGPVALAQARKERLERELAGRSAEFRRSLARRETGFSAVRSALPPEAALLAYVEFDRLAGTASSPASSAGYAAFVLSSSSAQPLFIPLGPAHEIDPLIQSWRDAVAGGLSGREPLMGASEEAYRKRGLLLRERVWDPLAPALSRAKMVFVVPDGALNLVNLATLPTGQDRYLIETGPLIHHLSTERDLVRRATQSYAPDGALIVGAPDLDSETAPQGVVSAGLRRGGTAPACEDFRTLRFGPLPASRSEIEDVASLVNAKYGAVELTGAAATETAFKAFAPGRRILHIATHGFFLQDRCSSTMEIANVRGTAAALPGIPAPRMAADNPLLLSGLTLAGANKRGERRAGDADYEDGMLTAEEVSALDLSGAEWAVLSACETGIGKVRSGEGVLGLRRAFAVAGAGTLIMSLWRVEDGATRIWMKGLYGRRLGGRSTADAVREAGLSMIRDSRSRGRTTHPFFWGGFVAEGDWR